MSDFARFKTKSESGNISGCGDIINGAAALPFQVGKAVFEIGERFPKTAIITMLAVGVGVKNPNILTDNIPEVKPTVSNVLNTFQNDNASVAETTSNDGVYSMRVGAFTNKANADKLRATAFLNNVNDAQIKPFTTKDNGVTKQWYAVVVDTTCKKAREISESSTSCATMASMANKLN